jgi:hypothetical protein
MDGGAETQTGGLVPRCRSFPDRQIHSGERVCAPTAQRLGAPRGRHASTVWSHLEFRTFLSVLGGHAWDPPTPMGCNWSYLPRRIGHLVSIWRPRVGSSTPVMKAAPVTGKEPPPGEARSVCHPGVGRGVASVGQQRLLLLHRSVRSTLDEGHASSQWPHPGTIPVPLARLSRSWRSLACKGRCV